MNKLIILTYSKAPYRDPIYSYIMRNVPNVKIYSFFKKDKSHNYWHYNKFNYPVRLLKYDIKCFGRHIHLGIFELLLQQSYDEIVIPGYYHYSSLIAFLISVVRRKKIILVIDNIADKNSKFRFLKKWIYNKSSKIWFPGKASLSYLINNHRTTE